MIDLSSHAYVVTAGHKCFFCLAVDTLHFKM
jgi:hypothetical protein